MKIEYYNKRGKHIKTAIYGGFKEIKGIWTITKIMVETPRKGSKALMQYDNVDYNIGLSDALFEQFKEIGFRDQRSMLIDHC